MKKFLLVMLMLMGICLGSSAQVYRYQARTFAYGKRYGSGVQWGSWQSSSIRLCLDINNSKFYVYSDSPQVYRIINCGDWRGDGEGGQQLDFSVIDQDGDRGTCRLRIEARGSSQFYVFFADVAWVYGDLYRLN